MIERRHLALAHELARADFDHRDAGGVVEVRNDPSAMLSVRSGALSWQRQNTYPWIAAPLPRRNQPAASAVHSIPRRRWLNKPC